jgi:Zn-dependent protease
MAVDVISGGMSYAVFLLSATCHEAAHAWAALRLGDDTAYRGGQVSLDPTPHVKREPFGMVVAPIASYLLGGSMLGWASAPFDPTWAARHPRRSALMALAGPAANLLLMLLAVLLVHAGLALGVFELPVHYGWMKIAVALRGGFWPFVAGLISILFSLNLLLFTFNLLPLPPLDGSAVPLLVLPESAGRGYLGLSRGLGIFGLFLAWKLFDVVFPPVWRAATALFFGAGTAW